MTSCGWHEGWDHTHDHSASTIFTWKFDLGAMGSPQRFEWVKMNLGHRELQLNTCPFNVGPDGAGDGRFCRTTASGQSIPDGGARAVSRLR